MFLTAGVRTRAQRSGDREVRNLRTLDSATAEFVAPDDKAAALAAGELVAPDDKAALAVGEQCAHTG